jgi:branched-chain amino acid aminotransferase
MYSSVFGGVVTDPTLMVLPIDDHMVHRGDGVFEALECVGGCLYKLHAHLSRLKRSAELISLQLPFSVETIQEIIGKTVAISEVRDCYVRVYVSRGIGGFDCSPVQCQQSQLYVIVLTEAVGSEEFYTKGATAVTVQVPVKPDIFARVKSCNYLPNALAHLEAHKKRADFAIMLDQSGYVTEGPTESVAIVNRDRIFISPKLDRRLEGTTLLRTPEFTRELIRSGDLKDVGFADISREEAYDSSEMIIFGTGLYAVPIVEYDGKKIGDGKPGTVARRLRESFQKDRRENSEVLTRVPYT